MKEIPINVKAALRKAVGNASAASLLESIVYFCTRKKGGVEYEGRAWSYREAKEWYEKTGLPVGTGKRAWKLLVEEGFILAEKRKRVQGGYRFPAVMHVALTDKTLAHLDGTHLASAIGEAEDLAKDHAKAVQTAKWAAMKKAEYPDGMLAAEAHATVPKKLTWKELSDIIDKDDEPETAPKKEMMADPD